jgi:hypothetical protein
MMAYEPPESYLEELKPELRLGRDLKVGDTAKAAGSATWHRIVSLRPCVGTLGFLWGGKARSAKFEDGTGYTVGPDDLFEVLA